MKFWFIDSWELFCKNNNIFIILMCNVYSFVLRVFGGDFDGLFMVKFGWKLNEVGE